MDVSKISRKNVFLFSYFFYRFLLLPTFGFMKLRSKWANHWKANCVRCSIRHKRPRFQDVSHEETFVLLIWPIIPTLVKFWTWKHYIIETMNCQVLEKIYMILILPWKVIKNWFYTFGPFRVQPRFSINELSICKLHTPARFVVILVSWHELRRLLKSITMGLLCLGGTIPKQQS